MRKPKFNVAVTLTISLAMAACGGGGGLRTPVVPNAPGTPPVPPESPPLPPAPPPPDFTDTGIAGSVGAPAPASFGSAPAQLETPGGGTFDGANPPMNATFPLIFTGFQKTSTGLTAVSGDQGATATVTSTNNQIANNRITTTVQLTIPSLSVNQIITSSMGLESPYLEPGTPTPGGLSYVVMGNWAQPGTVQPAYVFGYETPQTAMPTTGTAVFTGNGLVSGTVYKPVNGEIQTTTVSGNASISANFGSGAVTGSLKTGTSNDQSWNDVTLNANIATGTNKFSGTTAAASSPAGPMSLSASATGHIDGAFFGPAAQNLGAVWSLSDGTGSAIGTVVAGH